MRRFRVLGLGRSVAGLGLSRAAAGGHKHTTTKAIAHLYSSASREGSRTTPISRRKAGLMQEPSCCSCRSCTVLLLTVVMLPLLTKSGLGLQDLSSSRAGSSPTSVAILAMTSAAHCLSVQSPSAWVVVSAVDSPAGDAHIQAEGAIRAGTDVKNTGMDALALHPHKAGPAAIHPPHQQACGVLPLKLLLQQRKQGQCTSMACQASAAHLVPPPLAHLPR